jgi:hypothetical protein
VHCLFANQNYYMNALNRPLAPHTPHRSTHDMFCEMFLCLLHHLVKLCVQDGLHHACINKNVKHRHWEETYNHAVVLQEGFKRQEMLQQEYAAHKDRAIEFR